MKKLILLTLSHLAALAIGFAAGIYALPILVAPPTPESGALNSVKQDAMYSGEFRRDLKGSDAFHWGEGTVAISREAIALEGRISPGPDYRLFLSPKFVENERGVRKYKKRMAEVGVVTTFNNFLIPVPDSIDPSDYNTVVIWCESFDEFITSAQYQFKGR